VPWCVAISTIVARASARADELSPAELVAGGAILAELAATWRPRYLAVLGVTAYRTAFGRRTAVIGPQAETVGGVPVWVLPNPSGLNAHYQVDGLAAEFARLLSATVTGHDDQDQRTDGGRGRPDRSGGARHR